MAGVAEDVELPIRVHDLFLGMAGRIDDDALSSARELLAVGELTGAVEMLVGCLLAGRVVTNPREQEHLGELLRAVHSDPSLVAGLKVRDSWLAQQHRFSTDDGPDRGVGAALRPVLETLPGIESISCVWRITPAGAAPCALPQRVVLVQLGPEGLPTATSYRVQHALTIAGLSSVVEVLRPGIERSDYHSRALAEAHGVDGSGGNGVGHTPQQAPARPAAGHSRRAGTRVSAEPVDDAEPADAALAGAALGYERAERSLPDDRPLARPKPVVKRASVTRIQSSPASAPTQASQPPQRTASTPSAEATQPSESSRSDAAVTNSGDTNADASTGSPALAASSAPSSAASESEPAGKAQPAAGDRGPGSDSAPDVPSTSVTDHPMPVEPAPAQSRSDAGHHERPSETTSESAATVGKTGQPVRDQPSHLLASAAPRNGSSRPDPSTNGHAPGRAERDTHEPASAHFASTELAGIGPVTAEPERTSDDHRGPESDAWNGDAVSPKPVAVPEQSVKRRIPEMPASVAKNLNDKERDLLRQLHEELAQREQKERQDSKRWQLARPSQQGRENPPPAQGGTAWPPLATEETLVNGTPPGGWPGPHHNS